MVVGVGDQVPNTWYEELSTNGLGNKKKTAGMLETFPSFEKIGVTFWAKKSPCGHAGDISELSKIWDHFLGEKNAPAGMLKTFPSF